MRNEQKKMASSYRGISSILSISPEET